MKKEDWIKVEDRLPEAIERYPVSEFVLVSWEIKVFYDDNLKGASVAQYNYAMKRWLNRDNKIVVGVTHWMPIVLPKKD